MLLASLFLVMGSAWAKTVTVVNTERWYQFCCTSKDAVHGSGANVWLADDGTAFAGKSNTPTFFKFISAIPALANNDNPRIFFTNTTPKNQSYRNQKNLLTKHLIHYKFLLKICCLFQLS